jgi:hypothetical protein
VRSVRVIILATNPSPLLGLKGKAPILETGKIDFTHRPGNPHSRLLLVLVDTFTEWVEAFPYSIEKA